MLHNPYWNRPTVGKFVSWLRSKSGKYDWTDCRNCACAQFFFDEAGITNWIPLNDEVLENEGINLNIIARDSGTFEDLLSRMEAM